MPQINVPYLSQLDNVNNPHGSCNVTCVAMCMGYYGRPLRKNGVQLEDELYRFALDNGLNRHSPQDLQKLFALYGYDDRFTSSAQWSEVKDWIDRGKPCIVHGFFTRFGHIVVIVGYNETGFIVNDPYGEYWAWGYDTSVSGKGLTYSYGLMNRTCSPDGQLWIHFVDGKKDGGGSSSPAVPKEDWDLYDVYRYGESIPLSQAAKNQKLMRQIQIRLIMLGALPRTATADGLYGPITRAAIDKFARGFGIPSDPITKEWAEKMIEANEIPGLDQVDYLISPEIVAKATLAPLSDVNKYYPAVAAALEEKGIHNLPTLIAAIATIGVETGGFQTINEYGGTSYFTRMYEGRADLGNTEPGDGARYHGRGFIQVTGRANYREYGKALGVDLENNPDLALDPEVGAKVLAQYFWDRQVDLLARDGNWKGVRRAVNGGLNGWDVFWEIVRYLRGRI